MLIALLCYSCSDLAPAKFLSCKSNCMSVCVCVCLHTHTCTHVHNYLYGEIQPFKELWKRTVLTAFLLPAIFAQTESLSHPYLKSLLPSSFLVISFSSLWHDLEHPGISPRGSSARTGASFLLAWPRVSWQGPRLGDSQRQDSCGLLSSGGVIPSREDRTALGISCWLTEKQSPRIASQQEAPCFSFTRYQSWTSCIWKRLNCKM